MSRDRWYVTILILAFLILSVTILLVRWQTLLDRVPLAPVTPNIAAANVNPAAGQPETVTPLDQPAQTTGVFDLNSATAAELQELPGIGPVLGKRIVEYRNQHGPYDRVDDLLAVEGIGAVKLDAIRDQVQVGAGK